MDKTTNDFQSTLLIEFLEVLSEQIGVSHDTILLVPGRRAAVPYLVAFGLENHKQDVLLNLISRLNQELAAMVYHESAKVNEHRFNDLNWNDSFLGVVSVVMETCEDAKKNLLEQLLILHESLKQHSCNRQAYWFHSHLSIEKSNDDLSDLASKLLHVLRILAEHGIDELTLRLHQVLHFHIPVIDVVDHRLDEDAEDFTVLGRRGHEQTIKLEGKTHKLELISLDYLIQNWDQIAL